MVPIFVIPLYLIVIDGTLFSGLSGTCHFGLQGEAFRGNESSEKRRALYRNGRGRDQTPQICE